MVSNTLTLTKENYQEYTDKYFLRSKQILEAEEINPLVRYQIFARQDIPELQGITESINFIRDVVGDKVRIYSLKDGQNYKSKEPIMKLEGRVQDLIDLETGYLSINSGTLTGEVDLGALRKGARDIYKATQGKPVYDFSARHFAPHLVPIIAKICYEEGFAGTSTDIGAKAWNSVGGGTTPHALFLAYKAHMEQNGITGNPTVEAAKAYDKHVPKEVPRTILGCTFNCEITDIIETAQAGVPITGTRIDTCGENYTQGSRNIQLPELNVPEKYKQCTGVTIAGVWGLRRGLDNEGLGHLDLLVSSGFNAEKTKAFILADIEYQRQYGKPLFNAIGTGSFGLKNLIMTTSDICAYFDENKRLWIPNSKTGRCETPSKRLEERK